MNTVRVDDFSPALIAIFNIFIVKDCRSEKMNSHYSLVGVRYFYNKGALILTYGTWTFGGIL